MQGSERQWGVLHGAEVEACIGGGQLSGLCPQGRKARGSQPGEWVLAMVQGLERLGGVHAGAEGEACNGEGSCHGLLCHPQPPGLATLAPLHQLAANPPPLPSATTGQLTWKVACLSA